jgi:hypothetical protein
MLTPIVRELPRAIEPVVADTFIDELADRSPREQGRPANVIHLSPHRTQHQPVVTSARAA